MSFMEEEFGRSTWPLTAADIVMGYCLSVAEVRVGRLENRRNVRRFLTQIRAHAAYSARLKRTARSTLWRSDPNLTRFPKT
ncbi:hypothetical protein [Ruegeria sp. Ofav3-42]|uniref:hypothetical protein n=1 Tax=Ruegeria sp. Ofav3-42 TaxID=2917759 RepID=UPI001EF4604E|nr:hypothetical protein [Ruegeria sp. Ofav3-42]MCG7522600.1 hypothetical protein [Ruegeria sp. Ofav3-42]